MEKEIARLQEEIEQIKARNKRVEADKAWELSKTRTGFIAASTYLLIFLVMLLIRDPHPFLNAFLATVLYILSTESYGIFKKWWLRKRKSSQ